MGIGYRIKEAREQLGMTQTELGQKVGVTGSAITNYEKETSHPKEQVIYNLMEVLGVDANYLFQDCMHIPLKKNDINLSEYEHIKKYRDLDDHGKKMVDYTLEKEWERSKNDVSDYEKYRNALKFYNDAISNKKDLTVDDLVCPIPDETAPPKTISELADELIKAAHSISGTSNDDRKHDFSIMRADEF